MAVLSKVKSHSDAVDCFKKLPFYNKPIKKSVKRLENIDRLLELFLCEQLSVIKKMELLKGMQCHIKLK